MADPLTILGAASAASALAEQAIKVITFICDVYGKYQDPSFTIQQVEQLKQLAGLLGDINQMKAAQSSSLIEILKALVRSTEAMRVKLESILVKPTERTRTKVWKSFKGIQKKAEIRELLDDIEQQKSSLSLAMTKAQLTQGETIESILQRHGDLLKIIDESTRKAPKDEEQARKFYSVPSKRVKHFLGREDVFADIHEGFFGNRRNTNGPHVVVVRGLGGQGKTQIALEYCRRSKESFRGVFWVNATLESAVKESFQTIGNDIKDSGKGETVPSDATQFVLNKLSLWKEGWLLVFDNYDDVESFENIQDFMPDHDKGCILVTSRNTAAENLARDDCVLRLEGLPEKEALELLRITGRLPSLDSELAQAKQIIDQLAYHPLAITQAGSYIEERKLHLNQFLEHYKDKKKILEHTPVLTQYRKRLNNAEKETAMNVFTTWELSFEQLVQSRGGVEKGDILTLFAFFDNKDISEELFSTYCETVPERKQCLPDDKYYDEKQSYIWPVPCLMSCLKVEPDESIPRQGNVTWDSQRFCMLLAELARSSLVQSWLCDDDGFCHVTIHPLIREWIRLRLNNEKSAFYALLSTKMLSVFLEQSFSFTESLYKISLAAQQTVLSHIRVYEENRSLLDQRSAELQMHWRGERLDNSDFDVAMFLDECGHFTEAETCSIRAHKSACQNFGVENGVTMGLATRLAFAHWKLGKLDLAELMGYEALNTSRALFGLQAKVTLKKQQELADITFARGQFSEAEKMVRECLNIQENLLGPDHDNLLSSFELLGEILVERKKYPEAESILQRVLIIREKVSRTDHRNTLLVVECLGELYQRQGRLDLAEKMTCRALEGWSKNYGEEHPDTLACMHNLASVFWEQDKLDLAEEMMNRALAGSEKTLGKEHLDTLKSVTSLAGIMDQQNEFEQAELLYHRALPGLSRILGSKHPEVLVEFGWYEHFMAQTGKKEQAAAFLKELNIDLNVAEEWEDQEFTASWETVESDEENSLDGNTNSTADLQFDSQDQGSQGILEMGDDGDPYTA